jgi:arylsulfatase A-like enzyme
MGLGSLLGVLRRGAEGIVFGGIVGAAEFVLWRPVRGYSLPLGFLPPIVLLCGIWIGAGWLFADASLRCLPRRFRPAAPRFLLSLLTLAALVASYSLDYGHLDIDHRRFQIELAGLVLAALAAARLEVTLLRPRRMLRTVLTVLFLGSGGLTVALAAIERHPYSPAEPERPSVVLVLVDTLRVDRLSLFGAERPTSPRLDALARESFLFRSAYTPSTWTPPSVASILTGRHVRDHRVTGFSGLPDAELSIAEWFESHGYRTFGSVGNRVVEPDFGYHQGFQTYLAPFGDVFSVTLAGRLVRKVLERVGAHGLVERQRTFPELFLPPGDGVERRAASRIVSDFERWLAGVRQPYFAYLHFMEPHDPYDAPPPFRGRFAPTGTTEEGKPPPSKTEVSPTVGTPPRASARRELLLARYDEEVLAIDAAIGRIADVLRERGDLEHTILAIVSDHGEEFEDHGGWRHSEGTTFDEVSRGLLLVRFPGGGVRGESRTPVSLRDVARLLADRAGLGGFPAGAPALEDVIGDKAGGGEPVLVEVYPIPDQRSAAKRVLSFGAVEGSWKLARFRSGAESAWREWLFDLSEDPRETRDVAGLHPEVRERLAAFLDREVVPDFWKGPTAAEARALEAIRSLGYLQ